jgi:hypothetical protein
MTSVHRFGVTLVVTLAIWFALLIAAIVTVSSLSAQGTIDLLGGIAIFAILISLALVIDGYLWLRWHRTRHSA